MSFSYERYDRRRRQPASRRTTFGYWVPLVLTVTIATAGLAAWIWSERQDNDDSSEDENLDYGYRQHDPSDYVAGDSETTLSRGVTEARHAGEEEGLMARMSGAIRRTPSPQQVFDSASRKVAAGVAAAGAVVGGALSSIREEDKDAFDDHSRWSEEATLRRSAEAQSAESAPAVAEHAEAFSASVRQGGAASSQKPPASSVKRKTVAVVVSAEPSLNRTHDDEHEGSYHSEDASLLSHLPHVNPSTTQLFILMHAPHLQSRSPPATASTTHPAPPSMDSSYSAISTPGQTPGEELTSLDPQPHTPGSHTPAFPAKDAESASALYDSMRSQALRLVERDTMVMPFATPTGWVHMVRHLAPEVVYVVESLCGAEGENVGQIRNWVGQVVVVVGGGGGGAGLGGLVDTEDEGDGSGERQDERGGRWWEGGEMVGLGKGVEVVDGVRVGEDFERRVGGKD